MSIKEQLAAAMQLQQRRCETYHLWESKFRSVIKGELRVSDFDETIRTVIVKEFQSISVDLRTLYNEVLQELAQDPLYTGIAHPSGSQNSASSSSSQGERTYLLEVLTKWIDELQDVEKDHYHATIECFQLAVTHMAPNTCAATATAAIDNGGNQTSTGEEKTDAEKAKVSQQPSPEAEYSVHDASQCALRRLYPQEVLRKLYFVDCSAAHDALAAEHEDDDDDDDDEKNVAVETEIFAGVEAPARTRDRLQPLMHPHGELDGRTAEERQKLILGYYDPFTISRDCAVWSAKMVKVLARRDELMQSASALVEDLQCELSDLSAETL